MYQVISLIWSQLLMYAEESETIRRYFTQFARTKVGSNYAIVDINALGLQTEDKQIKRMLTRPMEEVCSL